MIEPSKIVFKIIHMIWLTFLVAAFWMGISLQAKAIEMLSIAGGEETSDYYVDIYRNAEHERIREAAITAMQISGRDDGLLLLYRESDNADEKRELLQRLVTTGSDEVWDLIDEALEDKE